MCVKTLDKFLLSSDKTLQWSETRTRIEIWKMSYKKADSSYKLECLLSTGSHLEVLTKPRFVGCAHGRCIKCQSVCYFLCNYWSSTFNIGLGICRSHEDAFFYHAK